ncbi:sensor histidine kinase [Marinicrinis sediminis]|uniref:histidine kinase n=1 Tax=Marinicrinis sediminis TaxID=1652465 RepID=A0ABW5R8I7_9BACL
MIVLKKLRHSKWQLLVSFMGAAVLAIGMAGAMQVYWYDGDFLTAKQIWITVLVVLLAHAFIGYLVARSYQRQLDELQLSLLQIEKGRYKTRMNAAGWGGYEDASESFNRMAAALEQRMKLLQIIGEERTMKEQTQEMAVLEERKRLARDLHDTVSQQLFAIHMSASSLIRILEHNPQAARQVMEQLTEMSHSAQKQMRGFIAQLRPMELEDRTLGEALQSWFPDYCRQNELQGSLDIQMDEPVSESIEHQVFFIIQEAMANIVKHAEAKHAVLYLRSDRHRLLMNLTDDGKGFTAQETVGSYGLNNMKERAEKLGGHIEIVSHGGAGTKIVMRIPLFANEADSQPDRSEGEEERQA